MKHLSKIESGIKKAPFMGIIHGTSGVGKSTFCASAPDCLFIPIEEGVNNINVDKVQRPASFTEVLEIIDELTNSEHKYKTVTIDSIDWLEGLCHEEVCKENGVKAVLDLAYGKGYAFADAKWKELIYKLKKLRTKVNIFLVAHSQVTSFSDPVTASSYDRYQIKLHKNASALFKEAVDFILFANYQTFVKKDGMKNRAFGDGARALFTEYRPSHDGKNRFGLPYELALSYDDFIEAMNKGQPNAPDQIKNDIAVLMEQITDQELKKKVSDTVAKAGTDAVKLNQIRDRLRIKLES